MTVPGNMNYRTVIIGTNIRDKRGEVISVGHINIYENNYLFSSRVVVVCQVPSIRERQDVLVLSPVSLVL